METSESEDEKTSLIKGELNSKSVPWCPLYRNLLMWAPARVLICLWNPSSPPPTSSSLFSAVLGSLFNSPLPHQAVPSTTVNSSDHFSTCCPSCPFRYDDTFAFWLHEVDGSGSLQAPSALIFRLCRGGTLRTFSHHLFSSSGRILSCSVAQLCLTLCDSMNCRPPGSSVLGILQARILEWAAISFSRKERKEAYKYLPLNKHPVCTCVCNVSVCSTWNNSWNSEELNNCLLLSRQKYFISRKEQILIHL